MLALEHLVDLKMHDGLNLSLQVYEQCDWRWVISRSIVKQMVLDSSAQILKTNLHPPRFTEVWVVREDFVSSALTQLVHGMPRPTSLLVRLPVGFRLVGLHCSSPTFSNRQCLQLLWSKLQELLERFHAQYAWPHNGLESMKIGVVPRWHAFCPAIEVC